MTERLSDSLEKRLASVPAWLVVLATALLAPMATACGADASDSAGAQTATSGARPEGVYAEVYTTKGLYVARLEPDMTPLAVTNFVGLAEGTIENDAFELGRPYFDGMVYGRVVAGHVIQTGATAAGRGPGYNFPNEIHADLSHDHLGALNFANGGPHTNAATFCVMLGDRSYLDGDYIVFGDVVEGLDVVESIAVGDVIDSIRVIRMGARAESFRPSTETFQELTRVAQARVDEHDELKRSAERDWIARNHPDAEGPGGGVLQTVVAAGAGSGPDGPLRVRYTATRVRYLAFMLGYEGPELEMVDFGSKADGVPGFGAAEDFTYDPDSEWIPSGLHEVLAEMVPGERRRVVIPADHGFGGGGLYPPETPGQPRFVISPNTLLSYDVEVLSGESAG